MVYETTNAHAVGFSPDGLSLELRDSDALTNSVLPRYFKHGNISSLTRQLNNYGFKTNPARPNGNVTQSFSHPHFILGRPDLYIFVKRRPSAHAVAAAAAGEGDGEKKARMGEEENGMDPSRPSYQQLVELNTKLMQQNAVLEEKVRQLEARLANQTPVQPETRPPYPPTAPVAVIPPPLTRGGSNSSVNSFLGPRSRGGIRASGEQAFRILSNPPAFTPSIRQSGEQARSLFGGGNWGIDEEEDEMGMLKSLLLRASMEDDFSDPL